MEVPTGPFTVCIKHSSLAISMGIFLETHELIDEVHASMHIRSEKAHGRMIMCFTKAASEVMRTILSESTKHRVTDVDPSINQLHPNIFVSPIAESDKVIEFCCRTPNGEWVDSLEATLFVIRELGGCGDSGEDTVTITALVASKRPRGTEATQVGRGRQRKL